MPKQIKEKAMPGTVNFEMLFRVLVLLMLKGTCPKTCRMLGNQQGNTF